ncbi:MAG: NTP transferase domain-containing protein [Chloroflexota bacterium]
MTVAAIVLPSDREEALADAAGRPAVRRIVDAAWAGGALPIVVVANDPDGSLAKVLDGSPALLVATPVAGESAAYQAGIVAAHDAVHETTAVLIWPGRMTWVDPETVTSLIEAHGRAGQRVARPVRDGRRGWPVMLPSGRAAALLDAGAADVDTALSGVADETTLLELGDPGSIAGREVALEALADYEGPREPVGGPPPEWGAAAAETPDLETPEPRGQAET